MFGLWFQVQEMQILFCYYRIYILVGGGGQDNFSRRNYDIDYKNYVQNIQGLYVVMIYLLLGIKEDINEEI